MSLRGVIAGRPDLAFRERAKWLLRKSKALDLAADVVTSKATEEVSTKDGVVTLAPKIRDRLDATELLLKTAGVLVSKVEDVTPPRPGLAPEAVLLAIPQILEVLAVSQQERAKLLQAVEVEATVVE